MISFSIHDQKFLSCVMNASGILCTTKEQLNKLFQIQDLVVSKSATLSKQDGNFSPRLFLFEHGSLNSIGLENPGYE